MVFMQPSEVIEQHWERIQNRDWVGLRALLADDLRVYSLHTREFFNGPEAYVAAQSEYPDGWSIRVLSIVAQGQQVASEVEVPHEQLGLFRMASFWTIENDKITSCREYWVTVGGEAQPQWRRPLAQVLTD